MNKVIYTTEHNNHIGRAVHKMCATAKAQIVHGIYTGFCLVCHT